MFAAKRKRGTNDSDDDEEPNFGRQILPVARLPNDFNGVPTDGLQYLFTVRRDARHLPLVTRVPNPYEVPDVKVELTPSLPAGPHPALPSEDWRIILVQRFKNFRKNSTQPTINVEQRFQGTSGKRMPDRKERDNWWAFISGRPERDWNPPKKPKKNKVDKWNRPSTGMRGWGDEFEVEMTYDEDPSPETYRITDEGEVELAVAVKPTDSLPTPSGTPAPQSQLDEKGTYQGAAADSLKGVGESSLLETSPLKVTPRQPTPMLLSLMDTRYCLHLLMYFNYWIDSYLQQPQPHSSHLTETHARWIFMLLSRVDEHLSGDDISQLRSLARSCLALIKDLMQYKLSSPEALASGSPKIKHGPEAPMTDRGCWIIISIITGFWRQSDLWMDAEAMLSTVQ